MAKTNALGYLKDIKAKVKGLKDNREALDKKYSTCKQEKNEMQGKFETVINDLRKKANYKNHILEQKLATFQRDYDKKELDLRELVQRSGLDSATIEEICKKMEEAIEAKNSILRNLKYSLAHATKAYNDAIRVYEAKLVEFGIPADELGLEPLPTNTSKMPAGLVAA
jgi:chromosome segregation ATPase